MRQAGWERVGREWTVGVMLLGAVLAGSLLAAPSWADESADGSAKASQLYDQGVQLRSEGDLAGAARAFQAAARADRSNETYREAYLTLWRVMSLRKSLAETTDPQEWVQKVAPLRAYYYEHGLYREALPLDRGVHERQPGPASTVALAQTLVQLGVDDEAATLLQALPEDQQTTHARALAGIAWARLGRAGDAQKLAEACQLEDGDSAEVAFDAARLQSLLGREEAALKALAGAFERTLPSRLEVLRARANACADLTGLRGGDAYAKVLLTESKVPESKCSSGSSCGKCPNRAGCAKSKAGEGK